MDNIYKYNQDTLLHTGKPLDYIWSIVNITFTESRLLQTEIKLVSILAITKSPQMHGFDRLVQYICQVSYQPE